MNRDGCGFLTTAETDAWIGGDLPPERTRALEDHAETCDACALLLGDRAGFADVLAAGPSRTEREAFDARAPMLLAQARRVAAEAGGSKETAPEFFRRGRGFGWAIRVAAILVVAAVGWSVFGPGSEPGVRLPDGTRVTLDVLPFDAPPEVRGGSGTSERWGEARTAWERGGFRRAAVILVEIESQDPDDVDATTYAGLAQLYAGDPRAATETLERASERARARNLPTGLIDAHLGLAARAAELPKRAAAAFDRAEAAGGPFAERARAWRD